MNTKFFIIAYCFTALVTAGVTMNDYVDCYHDEWPSLSSPGGVSVGVGSLLIGIIWPFSLTGMIVTKDNHEGKYCFSVDNHYNIS